VRKRSLEIPRTYLGEIRESDYVEIYRRYLEHERKESSCSGQAARRPGGQAARRPGKQAMVTSDTTSNAYNKVRTFWTKAGQAGRQARQAGQAGRPGMPRRHAAPPPGHSGWQPAGTKSRSRTTRLPSTRLPTLISCNFASLYTSLCYRISCHLLLWYAMSCYL